MMRAGRTVSVVRKRAEKPLPPGLLRSSLTTIARAGERTVYVGYPIVRRGYVIGGVVMGRTPRNVLKALYYKRERLVISIAGILVLAVALAVLASLALLAHCRRDRSEGPSS